ncbi:hypothetical protein [Escherichia coli]|uniref:hypothetical protein n=1 Tax=Escherichia coli TaxID=562 RepID=UPI00177F05FE|nr:hypothetical protein [Escherichia coli]
MPHYATCFPIVWRLRGLNATLRDQPPHGLAIKGVKCHGTRPACLHGLAIMGVKSHGTRPAGTVVIG